MKTPMQELIEQLNNVKPEQFCSIETIKKLAESLLDKERDLIDRQYEQGWDNALYEMERWTSKNNEKR